MRQTLIFLLITLSSIAYGQNNELLRFEKIAIDFFADSICNDITEEKIYYDGKNLNKGIGSSYVENLILDYYFFKIRRVATNETECNEYWEQYSKHLADFQAIKSDFSNDSIDYKSYSLDFKKPIIRKNKLKYTKIKSGFFYYYYRKVKGLFIKENFNLDLTRSVKVGEYYWIRIRQNKPDYCNGIIYIILISENGNVFDYIGIPWIQ